MMLRRFRYKVSVKHERDDEFSCLEFRLWRKGECREEAEIKAVEGLELFPGQITFSGVRYEYTEDVIEELEAFVEVRVRNKDGQTSNWIPAQTEFELDGPTF